MRVSIYLYGVCLGNFLFFSETKQYGTFFFVEQLVLYLNNRASGIELLVGVRDDRQRWHEIPTRCRLLAGVLIMAPRRARQPPLTMFLRPRNKIKGAKYTIRFDIQQPAAVDPTAAVM